MEKMFLENKNFLVAQEEPIESIRQESLEGPLGELLGSNVEVLDFSKLGRGWVANGYKVDLLLGEKSKSVVLRSLDPVNFSHDYPSDRVSYLLLQHQSASMLPKHAKSFGVIGFAGATGEFTRRIDKMTEFYQVLDWVEGDEYLVDFDRILKTDKIEPEDIEKTLLLSNYLAQIHGMKFGGDEKRAKSLYKRHSRDYVGSRFLMDVLDTYPEEPAFVQREDLNGFVASLYISREKIKNHPERLAKIHGDFHPGNIKFNKNLDFVVLDSSRHIWGEPADDVSAMCINYVSYSLRQTGKFEGDFKKLFDIFWNNYVQKTKDTDLGKFIVPFWGVRSVVLNHPDYFDVDDFVRVKLHKLSEELLVRGEFVSDEINNIIS